MSNRDSLGVGDLLPQDVVDIFAQEKHSKRGRKKRSHSLGRALGWLKGKKRKDAGAKGQSLGLGPALDLALDGHPAGHQGAPKGSQKSAVPKLHDDDKTPAPPLFQENVFIEGSRPKYLENLHTEALEGLKMMQQEETNNGVEYQDNESTISTMTHTDGEGGGFMTDSTIADSTSVVSVQSSVSTRSSRSGLTRQGSTFRPLNSGKREKTKTRRRHRKTVGGIPHHVQRELGLDRVGWTVAHRLDEEQLYNGDSDMSPTDGPPKAAESQTGANRDITVIQPLNKDQLKQLSATHAGHRDDLALLHNLVPDLSDEQRPQSLAVPWMTTANSLQQELPSPVMSMSPQAAYMSKIIPNAVLPPSIDVVEISRGRNSRNSVRTVSKSSLVLSSPAPSRASSRASTVRSSASRHHPPNMSDSSCWSNSESSETLVSDSSTISSSSTPRQKRSQEGDTSAKEDINKSSKCTSNGKLIIKGEDVKKDGQFARSLSVIKPKRAPPPPSRSYSLHNKMKRRSRDLAEVRVPSEESSLRSITASGMENEKNKSGSSPVSSRVIDSPGYNADTSSLDDSTGSVSFSPIRSQLQAQKAEEAAKVEAKNASQEKQEPLKEDKLSKLVSPSSGYSSQEGTSAQLSKPPHSSSPRHKRGILAKLQRLFPGSSPAASPPPPVTQPEALENTKPTENLKPDTSVDTASVSPSVRALRELFSIPPPPKVHAPPPPPPEVWSHSERSCELLLGPPATGNTYAMVRKNPKDRRQQRKSPSASTEGSVKSLVVERKQKNGSVHVQETKKVQESEVLIAEIHKENNDRLTEQKVDVEGNRKVTEKDEKVRVSDILNGMLVKAVERRGERLTAVRKEEAKKTNMDTLPAISLARIPPSPSPTSAHNPPQPPVVSPESSWPPPPPPVGISSPDELDFPLPPPPMFSEKDSVIPVVVQPERSIPGGAATSVVSEIKATTEAGPQKPSTSQGTIHPTLNIPPPPPYSAPPPPVEAVPLPPIKVSLPPIKEVSPPPTPKQFSAPPPKEESHLPPLKEVSPPPPPKEISPPPPIEVSLPPPKEFSPPPPIQASPLPPPKEFSPPPPIQASPLPPPKEFSPPPPKGVSPPPPPIEVSLPPPKEVSPLPPPKEVSPPPPIEVSPPPPKEVSPPPPIEVSPPPPKEVSPPPPKEVSPPPPIEATPLPPPKEFSPPPPKEVSPSTLPEEVTLPPSEQVSPPPPKESSPPLVEEAALPLVEDVSSTLVTVVSPPTVKEVSPLPPREISTLSTEEVSPPSSQENAQKSSEEGTPVSTFAPPESIPPPPPLQSTEQEIDLPQENIPSESETSTISSNSILTPPQSIPPPPPMQQVVPLDTATQEASNSPPSEVSIPPPPENSLSTEEAEKPVPSPPSSTENQPPEPTSAPVVQAESTPTVTPSLLQTVKLRSLNSSPEPPKAEEQPEAEVTMRNQEPSNQVPTSSTSAEAPQKPIRRSLIMISPPPTSPPAVVTSQPSLPKPQSLVIAPVSSSTALSPTKKSPPAMTATPSMNLQEAIRLRTAARSKGSPGSRLSLQSPTSPLDLHKSPTSTASFIFSKSNKRVVIETKPAPETKATTEKNLEVSSVTKVVNEAETVKKGVKVPPPVAKKPKTKGKEIETSEGTEQTAGQEALQESIKDTTEKTNGTAGTVEGGTPST